MEKIGVCFGCRAQVSMEFMVTIIMLLFVFSFGLFVFEERTMLNSQSSQKWVAQDTAYRISRSINSAYFMEGDAAITDYIYWDAEGSSVAVAPRAVRVEWVGGGIATAPLVAPAVVWNISDLNGMIVFRNVDGNVVVSYS